MLLSFARLQDVRFLVVSLVPVLCACSTRGGSSSSSPPEPGVPLRTLHAALVDAPTTPIQGNLRVAVLWKVAGEGGDATWEKSLDLGIAKTWPVHFTIDIAPRPPDDAIEPWPSPTASMRFATGTVVAYEDVNGNGQLDLIPPGSNQGVDVLRGADYGLVLEWYDATDAEWAQYAPLPGMARGMNLIRQDVLVVGPECVAMPCEARGSRERLPPDEEVVLPTALSPRAETLLCTKFVGIDSTAGDINTPCPSPLPSGRGVECLPWDRTTYLSIGFPSPLPTCDWRGQIHACGVHRDPSAPPPPGWPCP